MVTTRGKHGGGGQGKPPLGEVDRNRRPSRLAAASFPKHYTDGEDFDDSDDFIHDTEDTGNGREARRHGRSTQQNGGVKAQGGGAQQAGLRRSSRLSAPPTLGGGRAGEGGAGGAGLSRGGAHASGDEEGSEEQHDSGDEEDEDEDEDEDAEHSDDGGEASGEDSPQVRTRSARQPQQTAARTTNGGGGAGAGGADGAVSDSGGSGRDGAADADEDGDAEMAEGAEGAGADTRARRRASSKSEEGEELGEDDDAAEAGEEEEEEEQEEEQQQEEDVVVAGGYKLRGGSLNPLRGNPAKRPRYDEDGAGGSRRRQGRGDDDEDDEEEDDDDEEEEEDDEEEKRGGARDRRRERDLRRERERQRERGRKGKSKNAAVRYTLRDRSRMVPMSVQEQQRQREEMRREDLARKRIRERLRSHGGSKHGNGGSGHAGGGGGGGGGHRKSGGGGGWRGGVSDDDVPDVDGISAGNPWRALQAAAGQLPPWQQAAQAAPNTPLPGLGQQATAHGGAQVLPSSALNLGTAGLGGGAGHAGGGMAATPFGAGAAGAGAGPGGGGIPLAPWEQALLADAAALAGGAVKEKAGNAEINPVAVDPSVGFDQVGGLDSYVEALKEMVFLPLVYPELFARFNVQPPRGVLFYGPPGTGKTLVARALASHASRYGGRKVSFYMRKGADVLSKWVGEAERQLRMLFEEAQRNAPAIIFFDEIDGLAPVRSSRQDQIHNSIVSTLLALLDGLDSRGQVVVIGATNRPDALDGALRRPGRFDRELLFPLPGLQARRSILDIHTRKWSQRPGAALLDELAGLCVGYCGADLKALCAEAALHAVRRRYPQIYASEDKLLVEPSRVTVERQDFLAAIAAVTPASNRSAAALARPLSGGAAGVLAPRLASLLGRLQRTFPPAAQCLAAGARREGGAAAAATSSAPTTSLILPPGRTGQGSSGVAGGGGGLRPPPPFPDGAGAAAGGALGSLLSRLPAWLVARPRLLLCGPPGCGQAALAAALLYALEGLPAHAIGLPALLANPGARSPEEALVLAFVEARRSAPAILFLPHLHLWWRTAAPSLRATLVMLLRDLPPELPLLLLATAEVPPAGLDAELRGRVFGGPGDVVALEAPGGQQRREMLREPFLAAAEPADPALLAAASAAAAADSPSAAAAAAGAAPAEALPKDPSVAAARAAEAAAAEELAARRAYEDDQAALRALRMGLRGVTLALLNDRRWKRFWAPFDAEEDPEYWQRVSTPMDLATILARVDGRQYNTTSQFLADVALIAQGAREYFGEDPQGARHISRAAALGDEAEHLLKLRVPLELAQRCEHIRTRGGPAPPPPGLELPAELAAAKAKAAAAGKAAAGKDGHATHGGGAGGAAGAAGGIVTRQRAGHGSAAQGGASEANCVLMFDDPEMLLRRMARQQLQQQREREQQASAAGTARAGACGAGLQVPGQAPSEREHAEAEAAEAVTEDDAGEATSPVRQHVKPAAAGADAAHANTEEANGQDGPDAAGPSGSNRDPHAGVHAVAAVAPRDTGTAQGQPDANGDAQHAGTSSSDVQVVSQGQPEREARSADADGMDVDEGTGAAAATGAVEQQQADAAATRPSLEEQEQVHGEGAQGPQLERDPPDQEAVQRAEALLERIVSATEGWSLESLELLYTRAAAVVMENACTRDRQQVVAALEVEVDIALVAVGTDGQGSAGVRR